MHTRCVPMEQLVTVLEEEHVLGTVELPAVHLLEIDPMDLVILMAFHLEIIHSGLGLH